MNNATTNSTDIVAVGNQASLIALITFINKTISQYGLGLIWLAGNIGSAFNCAVFYRPTFRKKLCAIYFIAASFSQFFIFNLAVFIRMLEYGYDVPLNAYVWLCKIRFYLFYIFVANSHYNVILASIDRYFSSSPDALRRQRSSPKIAVRLIILNAAFWSLMYLHVIIFLRSPTVNVDLGHSFMPHFYRPSFDWQWNSPSTFNACRRITHHQKRLSNQTAC